MSPAGFFRVAGSIFYDSILLAAVLFFASFVFLMIPDDLQHLPVVDALKIAWYVLVCYAYFGGFWLKGNQTPGMKIWKIKLFNSSGGSPTGKQVSVRFLASILSWILFGLGFLWILFDRNNRSLHDHLSATCIKRST